MAPASAEPAFGQPASIAGLRALADHHLTACARDANGWCRLLAAANVNAQQHGFANAALIDAQQPGSGPAATREEWNAAGWQVRKGHYPHVWIIGQYDTMSAATAVLTRQQVRPTRAGASPSLPGILSVRAGSPDRALGALVSVARRRGYTINRPDDTAGPCTDWDQHTITIPASTPPPAAAAALAHQLAHIIRDEDLAAASLPPGAPIVSDRPHQPGSAAADCYGAPAVEADSTAWIVLTRLGVDPGAAGIRFPAARMWAAPDRRGPSAGVIAAAGERIVATANEITAHVGKILADLPAPPAPEPEPAPAPEPVARPAAARRLTASDPANWPHPDQALVMVNEAAAAFFRACLAGSWAATYLAGRGFGPDVCRRWQLGYAAEGWTGLLDHLRAAGYPDAVMEAAGLVRRSSRGTLIDVFRNRAMIPIRGIHGQIIAFAGRAPDEAGKQTPRYLNTRETSIYTKDHVLYGLAESAAALRAGVRPALVEGYFDVIAVGEASRAVARASAAAGPAARPRTLAAVAPGGTALSIHQMELLAGTCDLRVGTPLLMVLDPDSGGRKATVRDYELVTSYSPAATTPVLPEGADPADIFKNAGPQALAAALTAGEHPLADVAVDAVLDLWAGKLKWAEGQLHAVRDVARLLAATMPDDLARQVTRVQQRTGVPAANVTAELIAALEAPEAEPRPKGGRASDQHRLEARASLDFPAGPGAASRRPAQPPRQARRPGGCRPPRP